MLAINRILHLSALLTGLAIGGLLNAQSTMDTGSIRGRVTDSKGAALPGALIRVKGPQGAKGAESDEKGNFNIPFLTPGSYELTVTMDSYSTQIQSGVMVTAQQTSIQSFKLAEGSDTIVVKAGAGVDVNSTTSQTSINLTTAMESFARDRSLTSTFDFSPGVVANSGVGGGNPSISGASGLENQYLIGGVNITNSGYGGIGAYDAVLGPSGVGVTTDFLEQLDIQEGGFGAEYGGALGGVINATIRSGTNDWHGGVSVFFTPRALEGERRNIYLAGGSLNSKGDNLLDASIQLGGPIIKDKLFFFIAYNPVWSKHFSRFDIESSDIAKDFALAPTDTARIAEVLPNANREYDTGTRRVNNYAANLTWNITDKHKLSFIAFSSPISVNGLRRGIGRRINPGDDPQVVIEPAPFGVANTDSRLGASGRLRITDNAFSLKYFGALAPWINVEAQIAYHLSEVQETPGSGADVINYSDIRRRQIFNTQIANAGKSCDPLNPPCGNTVPSVPIVSPAQYSFGGLGLYQGGSHDQNINYTLKITNNFSWLGSHEIKWGGEYADIKFRENPIRTGPRDENGTLIFLNGDTNINPNTNQTYQNDSFVRIRTGASAQIRCAAVRPDQTVPFGPGFAACRQPRYRLNRGNFNPATLDTTNKEWNAFIKDTWTIKSVTLNLGVRYTRSTVSNPTDFSLNSVVTGNPLLDSSDIPVGTHDPACIQNWRLNNTDPSITIPPESCYTSGYGKFVGNSHSFKGEWSPRLGISWDVLGNGKSKLYANFARMFERIPQDLAIRSFGNEIGLVRADFLNPDLTGQNGTPIITGGNSTAVAPDTRLPYKDDFFIGYEFEIAPRFKIDVKGTFRKQGRILEDTQAAPVDAILNYYYQYRLIIGGGSCTNCAPGQTELFPGAGNARFGQYVLANVGDNGPAFYYEVYPQFTGPCAQYPNAPPPDYCDGLPTGVTTPVSFGQPSSKYKALSITATKLRGEGQHLSLQATYRISQLTGNYEGLFRSDNGQQDPNISSLFDFPNSHLARSQYTNGRLNTDTPHALRVNIGYDDLFIKNLSAAVTFKWTSGQLRTPFLAHPVYQNAGEIPGDNPQYYTFDTSCFAGQTACIGFDNAFLLKDYSAVQRGANGREPDIATWDVKFGYSWNLGKSKLNFDIFIKNLFNENQYTSFDEFVESQTAIINPLYGSPSTVHEPRTIRLGAKWSF